MPDSVAASRTIVSLVVLWLAVMPTRIVAQEQPATPVAAGAVTAAAMFRGNAARTGEQAGPGPVGDPVLRWRFHAGDVVTSSEDGQARKPGSVYAVDTATGTQQLEATVGDLLGSSPAVAGGVIYLSTTDGALHAIDATSGTELWKYQSDQEVTSSPAVVDGVVYVGSRGGFVYAVGGNGV